MSARIHVVRHAQSAGNLQGVFCGSTDSTLSGTGIRQLERLSARFLEIEISAVYSSPLRRAMQTAQAVRVVRDIPIHTEASLAEINGGEWEGLRWEEIASRYPQQWLNWERAPGAFAAPGGETMARVRERTLGAIMRIARENEGKTVAAVAHGCAIRNIVCAAMGLAIERLNEVGWCDNTSVSLIEADASGIRLLAYNDAAHLRG